MDCRECDRLNRECDRLRLAYRAALKTVKDNEGGDSDQQLLLMAMANEARIDMDLANAELLQHQDLHADLN